VAQKQCRAQELARMVKGRSLRALHNTAPQRGSPDLEGPVLEGEARASVEQDCSACTCVSPHIAEAVKCCIAPRQSSNRPRVHASLGNNHTAIELALERPTLSRELPAEHKHKWSCLVEDICRHCSLDRALGSLPALGMQASRFGGNTAIHGFCPAALTNAQAGSVHRSESNTVDDTKSVRYPIWVI
jgi:hypothetical protein